MNRIRAGGGGLRTLETETVALVRRFTTAPTGARIFVIDQTIAGLKNAGLWTKLDCLWFMAAEVADQALTNWISGSFTMTVNGTPTFTADRGYTGNNSSGYLQTGFNPTTAPSPQFTQNSASYGFYSRTSGSGNGTCIGHETSWMNPRTGSNVIQARLTRGATFASAASLDGSGSFTAYRTLSTEYNINARGTKFTDVAGTSAASTNSEFWMCAANNTTPLYSTRQLACAYIGGGLTDAEATNIQSITLGYIAAVGAAV